MSRELRQALEHAQVRLPELQKALAAPENPSFVAEQQARLATLRPLRAQVAEAELLQQSLQVRARLAAGQLERQQLAQQSHLARYQVAFWVLPLVGMVGIACVSTLLTFVIDHPRALRGTLLLVLAALPALGLGAFLRARIVPPRNPDR